MKECFGLYIGNDTDCFWDDRYGWSVVHACTKLDYSGMNFIPDISLKFVLT